MADTKSSYRQLFKSTSIFGGVQLFQLIITIIRSKVIAVLLGPVGMGISGLLSSTIGLIAGLTNFGLGTSAVKNVASAHGSNDNIKIATIVIVLRRMVWITGLLGAVLTIVLAPYLSKLTFGNYDYKFAFTWLSITLLLNQISSGQSVVLQGLRKIKHLAYSSMSGSVLGLIISIPIYYKFGKDGIVPSMIVTSIVSLLRTWYFSRQVKIEKVEVSKAATIEEGKNMLAMGFMLSLSSLFIIAKNYAARIFISNYGGVEVVGLFTAGLAIATSYGGLVFTAMGTDYYPKLASIATDNKKAETLINQQAMIALVILAPIVCFLVLMSSQLIILLYSDKFLAITKMVQYSVVGLLFRTLSWSLAFIFMAKGDPKLFAKNEFLCGIITFLLQIGGFYIGGLTGVGVCFVMGNFYYVLQVAFITKRHYNVTFDKSLIKFFLLYLQFVLAMLLIKEFIGGAPSYVIGGVVFVISVVLSIVKLEKLVGIRDAIIRKMNAAKII